MKRWPKAVITLRQGARVIHDSRRTDELADPAYSCPYLFQYLSVRERWMRETCGCSSIVAGIAPHWPSNKGTFEKPGLFEKDLVIEVTGQEGRRFWGNQILSGGGEKTEEPMIGELTGEDNKTVIIVDTDGYVNGRLIGDNVLSFCYMQAGGKTQSSVVSCTEVKRAP